MKKYIAILVMLISISGVTVAQQDPHYSLYQFNGLFLNPAYAGSHEVLDMMAIYRAQWIGVDGAPMSGNVSIQSPLKRNNYALGLVLQGDKLGLTNAFGANGSFAYRIRAGKTKLSLGIQAGFTYYAQQYSKALNELTQLNVNDNVFTVNKNMIVPNVGFGLYWYGKKFYVGASVPHLLPSKLSDATGVTTNTNVARQYNHYLFSAGGVIGRDAAVVKVKPTLLVKYAPGLNKNIPDFDFGLGLIFIDRIQLGANYRVGTASDAKYGSNALSGILMVMITHRLRIGYAYEQSLTAVKSGVKFGTHDIMLGYEFNTGKKRFVSPRFVSYF